MILGIRCPECGANPSLFEAPAHFEACEVMPAEAAALVLANYAEDREPSPFLSPSKLNPAVVCRREQYIAKVYDSYLSELFRNWRREEGKALHSALASTQLPGFMYELNLPDPEEHIGHPATREINGKLFYCFTKDILFRGIVDKLPEDFSSITDFKTKAYPWSFKKYDAPSEKYVDSFITETALQLNLYRCMVEDLYGVQVGKMFAWRIYQASRLPEYTFKKFDLPFMPKAELIEKLADFAMTGNAWIARGLACETEQEKDEVLEEIPYDGIPMFNGTKCTRFCDFAEICKTKGGKVMF